MAMKIHRGIQENKFTLGVVRQSYERMPKLQALPPPDGVTAPLPPYSRKPLQSSQSRQPAPPTIDMDISVSFITAETACTILGVEEGAPQAEIRTAYHTLAKATHPDKGGDTQEFQRVSEAYNTLADK